MWVNKTVYLNESAGTEAKRAAFVAMIPEALAAESDSITTVQGENAVMICGVLKLIFALSSSGTYSMAVTAVYGGESFEIDSVYIANGSPAPIRVNFHIAASSDGKVIDVKIRNRKLEDTSLYFSTDILCCETDSGVKLISFTNNTGTTASAIATRNFATSQALQRVSDGQAVYTVQKRTPYIHNSDSTKLDTISGKVLTEGGIRVDCIGSMLDSSYIAGDALYPSGSDQYYAVDDYSLILV